MEQQRSVKKNRIYYLIMVASGILFYFVPGKWISIESDSGRYLYDRGTEGVLPGYPMFISFFRNLLGEENFLDGVVITQCILAIACTFIFVLILQKQFCLKGWECVLLYLITMLPFSIYLPEVGITHQIMTEGITYAVFYIFFIMVLKTVWTLKMQWYFGSLFVAFGLGLVRSQMLFLQAVCFLLLLWIIFNKVSYKGWKKFLVIFAGAILGCLVALSSYKMIYAVVLFDNQKIVDKAIEDIEGKEEILSGNEKTLLVKKASNGISLDMDEATSQISSLIVSRGFFEAEPEDVNLFEDEMMQYIFLKTYEIADEREYLYQYAGTGLYMWEDLLCDKMGAVAREAIFQYDMEYPDVRTRSANGILKELGLRVLIHHFGRYLYHTMRLMIPSFIASVFFQIKPIYLLCHFITLFIYLFAIGGAVLIQKMKGDIHVVTFSFFTVAILVVMVVVINIVFMGLQRYVVYGMGIFYCAMYLQVKELFYIVVKSDRFKRGIQWKKK